MHGLVVYIKEGLPFEWDLFLKTLKILFPASAGFTSIGALLSFFSINYHLQLCAWFLKPFYLTYMRFSQSTHLLMYLSLETLMSIIRTG